MDGNGTNGTRKYIRYAIIALAAILVVLAALLIQNYISLRRAQIISARELWLSAFLKNRGPLTAGDVTFIRPWMTFDYVNKLFEVPPEYLRSSLSITQPSYPQLSLDAYAHDEHTDAATVVNEVERSLQSYLNASSTQ